MDRLHRAYRRAESQLISVLERRKGEVQTFYGDLMLADGVYGGSQSRRWKVDWNKTPQPIQVKLQCLRGVRDKLPGNRSRSNREKLPGNRSRSNCQVIDPGQTAR
jgi:hypothetical protein